MPQEMICFLKGTTYIFSNILPLMFGDTRNRFARLENSRHLRMQLYGKETKILVARNML